MWQLLADESVTVEADQDFAHPDDLDPKDTRGRRRLARLDRQRAMARRNDQNPSFDPKTHTYMYVPRRRPLRHRMGCSKMQTKAFVIGGVSDRT